VIQSSKWFAWRKQSKRKRSIEQLVRIAPLDGGMLRAP
jgi:hypothetical protein